MNRKDELKSGQYKQELSAIVAAASMSNTRIPSKVTSRQIEDLDLPIAVKDEPEHMLKPYLEAGQICGFKERKRTAYIVGNTGICIKWQITRN